MKRWQIYSPLLRMTFAYACVSLEHSEIIDQAKDLYFFTHMICWPPSRSRRQILYLVTVATPTGRHILELDRLPDFIRVNDSLRFKARNNTISTDSINASPGP